MVCRCACGLDIILRLFCITFSHYNCSGIITIKVNRLWVPCVLNSSYSYMPILLKLDRSENVQLLYSFQVMQILIKLYW